MSTITDILVVANIIQPTYSDVGYRTAIVGTSDCNDYVPVYAIGAHKLLMFKDSDVKVMEYSMPISSLPVSSYVRTYIDLLALLKAAITPRRYHFKVQGENHNLNIHRGLIYDNNGDVLLCLGINKDYLLSVPEEVLKTNPDPTKFVLFISDKLDDPLYKNIKKKIDDMYITHVKALGLDIVTTSRIGGWLFKNNVKKLKFKTITALTKHLKEEVPMKVLEL